MTNREELNKQQQFDPANKEAYESLFSLLEKEPGGSVDEDMAYRVIKKIEKKERLKYIKLLLLFSVVGVFCVMATIGLLYFFLGKETITNLTDVTSWAAFAGLAVVLIQYFDNRLIRRNKMDWMT